MDGPTILVLVKDTTYLTVKDIAKKYNQSLKTVYKIVSEIKGQDRYKTARVAINEDACSLINTLVYEDYLFYRDKLKHRNIARHLPPYDPAIVRAQHGEYKRVMKFDGVKEAAQ